MMNQAAEGHTDADSLLASATDLLNTWAREMSVEQAHAPEDIKGVIDRLWSELSTRLHPAARAEGEPPQALTGESLRKLAYEKCGLQPAWMENRWQRLADSIVEFIGAGEQAAPGRDGLREAAQAVLNAADTVHYTGPTFGQPLARLRAALTAPVKDARPTGLPVYPGNFSDWADECSKADQHERAILSAKRDMAEHILLNEETVDLNVVIAMLDARLAALDTPKGDAEK